MVMLAISSFAGISPKTPARYLQDSQAQVAINCPVFSGSIQPLPGLSASILTLPKTGTPSTIYRFGQDETNETNYWFHWTNSTYVDVARGAIAGDTEERTYFTGHGGVPQVTNATLALTGGTSYPMASYDMGVPAPTSAIIAAANGAGDDTVVPESRVYTYTWVRKWAGAEEESAPAGPSNTVSVTPSTQTVDLTLPAWSGSATNLITHRRIYRSTSGTYLFVAELPVATLSYNDAVEPDDLSEELPSLTWVEPPDDLEGIVSMPNGIMAGFTGRDIYFCDPYHPFAWPVQYSQTVDHPIVGLGVMDTTLAVLTKGSPVFIQGTHPDSMAVVKADVEQACVSKRSIVSANGAVLYASPDGLVMLSSSGTKILTENLFSYQQWQAYFKPESIHAYQHDLKYVAFYDTGTTQGGFIYDLVTGQFILHNLYATAGYNDLRNDTLYLAKSDRTLTKWYGGTNLSYTWRSKKFTLPQITGFSCAQIEAESYNLTAKFYADGTLVHTQTVTSRTPFRLPPTQGRDWEIQIEGDKEVFKVVMAQSMQEIAGA